MVVCSSTSATAALGGPLTLDNALRIAGLIALCWVGYELHELRAQQYETTLRVGGAAADIELLRQQFIGPSPKEVARENARRTLGPAAKTEEVVPAPPGASQTTLQRAIDEAARRSAAASAARGQR
jgi:hypothetical protein